ncbi:MAG: acyl carrier protein [Oscillospiraceae bacterium]|nr:acyl carrier protein [Clostridia bacterium]MBQ3162892.1 acyl carrier protein [Oscillospiraceae bacterium]MBQ7044564.1 acyl carrier protein [Clostridia bacterium]
MQTFERLVQILEEYVEADEIKAEDSFKLDLGMSSFDTMCMVNDIKSEFGVELKANDFVNNKTVGEMAKYIESIAE